MLREARKKVQRFFASLVEDGSERGTPFSEWAAPLNQKKFVTRGELLSVIKNMKAVKLVEEDDPKAAE